LARSQPFFLGTFFTAPFFAILLVFIVGDGAPDVPLINVSVSISFVFFYTMFGAKIYNIVCFFSLVTNPSPAASMSGC
ncbi:hypothetical protein, partial [Ruminococcus sp.]|uniref:hypothetical protein n=1 Tax=Ruminococcus sp. TaxID=41978 RepID=UPI0025801F04